MKVGNGRSKMKNWKWMLILHFTFSIFNFTFAATTATREMVTNFAARVSRSATDYTDAATNQLAQAIAPKADAQTLAVELASADWFRHGYPGAILASGAIDAWNGSYTLKGSTYECALYYNGAWVYTETQIRLGGSSLVGIYSNTASRAATELTFGNILLTRTNETWTTTAYPVVYSNQLAQAVAPKADAVKTVSVNTGGASTNLVVRPVYATVNLVIRECETANGQKQYRLIRKED